jgi:hypothetical protein
MELLLEYLFFSSVQFACALSLMLALFRFSMRENWPHIAFTALILAQASFITREVVHTPALAPLVQLLLMIVLVSLMFRIQIIYSSIMVTIVYIFVSIMETIIVQLALWTKLFTLGEIINERSISNMLQLISSLIVLLLSIILHWNRIGFSFVPDNDRFQFSFRGLNLFMLLSVIVATSALALLYSLGLSSLILNISFGVAILSMLLYLAMRKESS